MKNPTGRYHKIKCIYNSNNSIVYKAVDIQTDMPVVLKTENTNLIDTNIYTKLQTEYKILSSIKSDFVPRAIDFSKIGDEIFIVMEYCAGITISEYIKKQNISLKEFLFIAQQVVHGLSDIHSAGVIHKDINPSNIIYDYKTRKATIIDFGISTEFSYEKPSKIDPTLSEGTLYYISPEQTGRMNRYIDFRTDFYSLGVTFFEILCQCCPFESESPTAIIYSHLAMLPPLAHKINPKVPAILSRIIYKLMEKMPEDRYLNAEGILFDLNKCLANLNENDEIAEFELGRSDYSDRLQISKKLYGRENEISGLMAAYHRIINGGKTLIAIGGHSGIGKTSLVGELHKPIANSNGLFIEGKFDQYHRNVPYYAFFQVIHRFCDIILLESEKTIAIWKTRIANALGTDGKLLIDKVPRLALLAGEPQDLPELPPVEERARFESVIQSLLATISSPEQPLVMFIDDIHLADLGSLEIIEEIMSNEKISSLLIISCYRNEADDSGPLIHSMDKMINRQVDIQKISLTKLELDSTVKMLADTLHCNADLVAELAGIVYAKTNGNPFYIKQFLRFCHMKGLIFFDKAVKSWRYDAEAVKTCPAEENVVDFLIRNVDQIDAKTTYLLSLGACIGQSFDTGALSVLSGKKHEQILSDIKPSVLLEIVFPIRSGIGSEGEIEFHFSHDRYQQTFYSILSEYEKSNIHYILAAHYEKIIFWKDDDAETKFVIADNYSRALSIIDTEIEKRRVSGILLRAAHSASLVSALDTAVSYLEQIIGNLSQNSEDNFIFSVYSEYHSVLCSLVRYEDADKVYILLEKLAGDPIQLSDSCCLQAVSLSNRGRYQEAFMLGAGLLKKLGLQFPDNDLAAEVNSKLDDFYEKLRKSNDIGIDGVSETTDINEHTIQKILNWITPSGFFFNPIYSFWAIITNAIRVLNNGYSHPGLQLYASLLMVTVSLKNDYSSFKCAFMAMKIAEQKKYINDLYRIYMVYSLFNIHWYNNVQASIPYARESLRGNIEIGDFEFACYSYFTTQNAILETCSSIDELASETDAAIAFANKTGNKHSYGTFINFQQFAKAIRGEIFSEETFNSNHFNEKEYLAEFAGNTMALCYFYTLRALSSVIYSDFDTAYPIAENAAQLFQYAVGHYIQVICNFVHSLVICKRIENHNCSEEEKSALLEKLNINQKWLGERAADAPMNFSHLHAIIEAEKTALSGQPGELAHLYEKAIDEATKNKRPYHHALICDLTAQRFFKLNAPRAASTYLREAYLAYLLWGATGKAEKIRQKYNKTVTFNLSETKHNIGFSDKTRYTHRFSTTSLIDFDSVIKASQAISGEIKIEAILEKLINVLLKNTGAQDIYYLTKKENVYVIQAEGHSQLETVSVLQERFAGSDCIPMKILNYVDRAHETIILDNAAASDDYGSDEYIFAHGCKSAMCMPIINKGEIKGILYLQNNLIEGAFDKQRTEALKIIASQLAISLENSYLFNNLQQLVAERTRELREEIAFRKSAENRLEQMANHDYLTNLPNRRMFHFYLEHAIEHANINKTFLAVMFVDLDGFKGINDKYGHDKGDLVLTVISKRLLDAVRSCDTVSRMGGDEFVLLLKDVKNIEEIKKVSDRILKSIEEPIILDDQGTIVAVTSSIGISILNSDGKTAEDLISNSDKAMYKAKNNGRNQFSFYSEKYIGY